MDVSSHTTLLPPGKGAPEWVHLIPSGTFFGKDGRGPYKLPVTPQAVIAASMTAGKLPLDENHSTQTAAVGGGEAPARGWIVEMHARADGIWGRVEWTPSGQALMAEQSYRGISPVFAHDKSGTVSRIISAALTNAPNLTQLATLHTNPAGEIMDIKQITAALGLAEGADEAAVLAAVAAQRTAIARHTAEIERLKAASVPVGEVVALQTQLAAVQKSIAEAAAEAFIDAEIAKGKPLTAVRTQLIAQHVADPEMVKLFVAGVPALNAGRTTATTAAHAQREEMMTDTDKAVMKKMGISATEYAAYKKKAAEKEGASA